MLAQSPDEETACGVTTDGRIVFTRQTQNGGDIYAVNEDGTGMTPVRLTPADEACFGVTGNNMGKSRLMITLPRIYRAP